MSNVVTMSGTKLMRANDLLQELQARDDIEHVVVLVERTDGFTELWHDRQSASNVVLAAKVLDSYAEDLARTCLVESD